MKPIGLFFSSLFAAALFPAYLASADDLDLSSFIAADIGSPAPAGTSSPATGGVDIVAGGTDIGGASDYVTYWFRKTHDLLPVGGRAGLVGTANIRTGDSRANSLDYINDHGGVIYEAVSSQPWSGDASVEVSIVNWTKGDYDGPKTLWLSRGATKLPVEHIVFQPDQVEKGAPA